MSMPMCHREYDLLKSVAAVLPSPGTIAGTREHGVRMPGQAGSELCVYSVRLSRDTGSVLEPRNLRLRAI